MDHTERGKIFPECKYCGEPDCAQCTRFGARFLLTDPVFPWPPPGGRPVQRPEAPPPWETPAWAKK